ncbi:uncharacterized protein BCR38DRAFT_103734 [Pseudomassariella vexata]|uniref:Uncharacterized protein n=1 Tax=Pseudomassariella vexata TaxID=1141098 RepID=A0A1Y2EG97_9PEZI|nr:uncharacterized protein BCR38DRAFT_103734 [Pseudomassariella vexata]ORY70286.1 hypothetical protein BCR38DRAFT_103734 [Pseudomassariella vexata]
MELSIVSQVCRRLHEHADADIHWQRYVHSNLPGNPISSPYPFKTFRELYICHDPYWFIPKHKFWFSDRHLTGQMIVAQYDQRRGVIEGYQLLGIRNRDGSEPWDEDQGVHIHYFEPIVKLHRDKPILQFNTSSFQNLVREESSAGGSSFTRTRQFQAEKPMLMNQGSDPRFSNVILAKPLTEAILQERMLSEFPYGNVWPPPQIPAAHRVPGQAMGVFPRSSRNIRPPFASTDRPANRSEMSDQAFHVRQWMEMGQPALGLHHGEEIVTYSTLDPALYTPTAEKPWRGVWVGDYSGHGCEFLLIHQPDNDNETDDEALVREENETEHAFNERFRNERVYRGRLEAIKLTGDPNVPRGEYTFVADNLANDGIVEIAEHPPFAGARMVKSRGHIASMGFLYGIVPPCMIEFGGNTVDTLADKFVESRLILISHDCLAQYWVGFGHISYFERVDIDQFLKP